MTASDHPVAPVAGSDSDRDADHRRARRERARHDALRRRQRRRRVTAVALGAAAAVVAAMWISGLGASGRGAPAARTNAPPRATPAHPTAYANSAAHADPAANADPAAHASSAAHTSSAANARPATTHTHPAAPSPGSRPQTHAYPSGTSAHFKSLMASLWAGVVRGTVTPALAAFFPKGAYVQLKAIGSAGSDWTDRLVGDYRLDIAAAHALLGRDAARARLVRVDVPSSYGHWIEPGVCYNSIGYYELPNARVVYRENGQIRSFGIASMISWRGVWYVVHLGAILRSTDTGEVDEPAAGPGSSAYSGTC